MLPGMIKPRILLIFVPALLLCMRLSANPEAPTSDPELNPRSDKPEPASESSLNLRLYRLFDRLGTDYDFPEDAYAMDVVATIEECNDGSRNISAMNIGGWTYDLDSSCGDKEYRGIISINKGKVIKGKPVKTTGHDGSVWNVTLRPSGQRQPVRSTIICDASDWSCTTSTPGQQGKAADPGNDDEY